MRIIPMVAGTCLNVAALTERGAPWRLKRYPAGFVLLLHPQHGPVLFDTGYSPRVLQVMRRWPGRLYRLITPVQVEPYDAAAAQLSRLGFAASEIRQVIVSHLHADHVGGVWDFPAARFLLDLAPSRPLLDLRGLHAVRRAFLPELLPPDFITRCRPLSFRTAPAGLAPFHEAADVFEDGSVYALRVPGHAPGMTALVVRTRPDAQLTGDGSGLALLGSDVAWSVRAVRSHKDPHPVARLVFADPARERESRQKLREWLARHPSAQVVVSHDAPEGPHV